ncbi:MAG: OmpA family protein [Gelidibacter sp.]
MKTNRLIITVLLGFICATGFSQKGKVREANEAYDNYSYLKTSEILLEVANNGYKSADILQKLGNSFYFNNQMKEAAKWYGELMSMGETVEPEYYFRYAQALKANENYDESDKWMKKFHDADRSDLRGKAFASRVDYLSKIEAASRDFEVKNMEINSSVSDFGTTEYKNQLIFASTRGGGRKYGWNEQSFLDLYSAEKREDGTYGNVSEFGNGINTKFHESTVAFTPDGNTMYFTRNNYLKGKFKKDDYGTNRLKIYRATLNDGKWDNVESIPFNSDNYSVAHPSINSNGTRMFFASDMEGTLGSSDIFVVDINEDGTLGEPVNLGPSVNTEGHETFPFINSDGDLYYSSNGFAGLGGLDVFVIRDFENKYEKSQPLILENVGKPINSPKDDFGYYENLTSKEGFFTSNRDGGKGDDDIYTFKFPKCKQVIDGIVKDETTQELIPGAKVTLLEENGKAINQMTVGADAKFSFDVDCDKEYLIRVEKDSYSSDEVRVATPNKKQELKLEMNLKQDEQKIEPGTDLAKTLDIPIIYFDFDKSNIRPDAEVELQKVIAVLKKYPTMKIDVKSHTDSRASTAYNDALSKRRNKSTIDYIVKKGGIDKDRLTGNGYGESQLVNKCSDGVECTEAEHQLNRRSEFIIVKM